MNTNNESTKIEKEFFLQVLADYLNKRPTVVPENLDWNVLEEIGEAQELTGIIYYQCKSSIAQSGLPDTEKNKWKWGFMYNFDLYSKRVALLKQIDAEFQKENIPYLIFKGTEIAKFYPVPAQRTMGDSDILVKEEDKKRACEALVRAGFTMNAETLHEWKGIKNETEIELHHGLIYNYTVELEPIYNWGKTVWEHTIVQKYQVKQLLDLTYHMVYTMLHLRKHFLEGGVGFRQFMDVAVLAVQPEVNWKQAELWFKELGLEKFSQVCFAFCKRWFGVKIPVAKLKLEEMFYDDFTEREFSGGVFGLIDKESKENLILNEAHFNKTSGTYSILKHIFLPYDKMRCIPYCRFLKGRAYLLPLAWCWRVMYILCTRSTISYFKGAYDNKTIKKKEDMLTKWGL